MAKLLAGRTIGYMEIQRGDVVHARTASGDVVRMVALGAPMQGHDFPVVWVCTEPEWQRAVDAGDEPDGLPWPITAIAELEDA